MSRVTDTIARIRRDDSDFITPETIRAYTGCTLAEARAGIVEVFGQDWIDRQDATGITEPIAGATYRAKHLPAGSVVRTSTNSEYVRCQNIDSLMRWEQPIPGSGEWLVTYLYQLPAGERMTAREKREVEEARRKRDAQAWARDARP